MHGSPPFLPLARPGDRLILAVGHMVEAKRKASFCEQKEAKKLFSTGPCWFRRHRPRQTKVFGAAFFQKSGYFLVST
jgi:hypothetical protein